MNNSYYGVDIRTIDSLAMADLLSQILAGNMRKEDREELEAQGRMPYGGLYESMTTSIEAYYAMYERMPLAAFGIGLCPEGCSIWMLGTTMCERHKKAMVACMQDYIKDSLKKYKVLTNYISKDNTKALRVIKRMGAAFGEEVETGGKTFVRFTLKE